jgi:hypothetical protein
MKFIELGLNCRHLIARNESTYARFESRFCGVEQTIMPKSGTPSIVPYGTDQTVYLVVDRLSGGGVYRETEVE